MRAFAVLAVLVAASLPYPDAVSASEPFWKAKGCDHGHKSAVAYERLRTLLRHTRPTVRRERVQHYATCVATRAKAHAAHVRARGHWAWRHSYPQVFRIRTNRFAPWVLSYLAALRPCESGGNYSIDTGNSFYGAYQFTWGTWASVGGSGNPAHAAPAEQDYRAAVLLTSSGPQHWPNCP